ncbi:hypothetical protein D6C92_09310 [Aureobasidium pullulans]|nr:hypothetical protein D6C92_09310 [Aureobasidium pullulans]TIA26252.1 hypothetical protein D6C81_00962 [Aureobasidium pullulans]
MKVTESAIQPPSNPVSAKPDGPLLPNLEHQQGKFQTELATLESNTSGMDIRTDRLERYKHPEDVVEPEIAARKRRKITVYEAVAGKAGYESLLPSEKRTATKYRDTQTNSLQSVPPDEVLFRRQGAPERYEESDVYRAPHTDIPLPDSDLLKFIHRYASAFYSKATLDKGQLDFQSLDETALLALGILLEETAALHLGETGHSAFIEDENEDIMTGKREYWNGEKWVRSVIEKKPAGT